MGSFSLGLGEECASAVGAGRRREPLAMKVEGDFWASPCCILGCCGARAPIAFLIGRGLAPLVGRFDDFLLFLVAAKS